MVYLFNPENDLALSNFSATYTPPASAVKMAEDLSLLPLWYADDTSFIWAKNNEMNQRFTDNFNRIFNTNFQLFNPEKRQSEQLLPWGWNPSLLKKCLNTASFEENYLCDVTHIQQLRTYSHRKNAVEILRQLKSDNDEFCGESHYFTEISDLLNWLNQRESTSVFKMPLSGSGKGLVWIIDRITTKQTDWAKRVILHQGGVVAEPKFQNLQDFAMEFELTNGNVKFVCYSLFDTYKGGAYKGNYLLSDEEIENHLVQFGIPQSQLGVLKNKLSTILSATFPEYQGILGVDMMVCKTLKGNKIHPCVEVNLRMNMGVVAHKIYENFLLPASYGKFFIKYLKNTAEIVHFFQENQKKYPLSVENDKIRSGFFPLTPISKTHRFIAYIFVEC